MTEAEWFAANDIRKLLWHLSQQRGTDRKLRLFAVACCRRTGSNTCSLRFCAAIDEVERLTDTRTNEARTRLKQLRREVAGGSGWTLNAEGRLLGGLVSAAAWLSGSRTAATVLGAAWWWRKSRERQALIRLLRDVVGNPFRPVRFASRWRTTNAILLAQQMYESRDFGAMPILADALQDAGCDSDAILNHCRDTDTPHVRGCWVVDLVLGKS